MGGWLSPLSDGRSPSFFRNPTPNIFDESIMSAFNPERQREEDLILQMRRKNDMTFATPDAKRVLAEKRALKPLEFTPLMRSPVKKTKADGKESSPSVQEYIPVKSSPPSTPMLDLEAPPPLPSSSIKMSPIPCLRPRAGQKGTNIHSFTFKEQEKLIDRIEKENFGLKLKIYHLEEFIQKMDPHLNTDVVKENTELRVARITLLKELRNIKKQLKKSEQEIERLKRQLETGELGEESIMKPAQRHTSGFVESSELEIQHNSGNNLQSMQKKFEEEIAELRESLAAKDDEIQDLHQTMTAKDDEIQELHAGMEAKDDEIEDLKQCKESNKTSTLEFRERLIEQTQCIQMLEESIEEKRDEIKELKQRREANNTSTQEYRERLIEQGHHIQKLEQSLEGKDDELEELKQRSDTSTQERNRSLIEKEHEIIEKEREIIKLNENMEQKELEKEREIIKLKQNIEQKELEIEDLKEETAWGRRKVQELETDKFKTNLRHQIEVKDLALKHQAEISDHEKELKQRNDTSTQQRNRSLIEKERAIITLKESIEQKELEIENLKEEMAGGHRKVQELETDMFKTDLRHQMEVKDLVLQHQAETSDHEKELQRVKDSFRHNIQSLQSSKSNYKRRARKMEEVYGRDVQALKTRLAEYEENVHQLEQASKAIQARYADESNAMQARSADESEAIQAQHAAELRRQSEKIAECEENMHQFEQASKALQAQHTAELTNQYKKSALLDAKYKREQDFRARLAHQKSYLTSQIEIREACNALNLRILGEMGFGAHRITKPKKPTLKSVATAIIAAKRMQKLSDEWAPRKKLQAILKKSDEERRARRGSATQKAHA